MALLRAPVLAFSLAFAGAVCAQPTQDAVRAVFVEGRGQAFEAAADAFLERVATGGATARDLAQIALVAPPSLAQRGGAPTGRAALAAWWRRQDPRPATAANERLIEHLQRVVAAEHAFPADRPTGLDARGETFVRYGSPARRRVIDFEGDLFIAQAIREEPSVRRSDFPRNEAWHYPDLGPDVFFVFAERRGAYEHADPLDLIPRALQAGGLSRQTEGRALLLAQVLRWLYKDLYVYSAEIRNRLLTLDSTVGGDGVAFEGNTALVLQSELQRASMEDADAREARDAALPLSASRVGARPFGLAAQAAVFLDRDTAGETAAVWVGWVQPADGLGQTADSLAALGVVADHFLVDLSVVRYDGAGRRTSAEGRQDLVGSRAVGAAPQWAVIDRLPLGGGVGVEWGLYPATPQGEVLIPQPVGVEALRIDSVGVVWAGAVGMSGLLAVDGEAVAGRPEVDRLGEFPDVRPHLAPGADVALYYELYHRGDDPREVELEVRALRGRDGRLFRRATDQRLTIRSRLTLQEWRTPQLVLGATQDLEGLDTLILEVAVTDLATGIVAVQSVTFDLRRFR